MEKRRRTTRRKRRTYTPRRRAPARRRTYARKRSNPGGGGSLLGGSKSPMMKGLIGGAVAGFVGQIVPIPLAGAPEFIAGYLTKNPWLTQMGGYQLGRSLATGVGGLQGLLGGGNNNTGAGSLFGGD